MKPIVTFIITLTLSLASCEKIDLGKEFKAKIGERYSVTDDFSFRINYVNDSRCPEGAKCVWAGIATIYFEVDNMGTHIDTLSIGESWSEFTVDTYSGPYSLIFTDVIPYPNVRVNLDQDDLRVKVLVNRE